MFILALDQGTTGSVAVVFDGEGRVVASADREIGQRYPQPGWVEHDPEEIFRATVVVGREALARAAVSPSDVAAIGITNQRETTVVWERATGRPVHPAVVWQSRASAPICETLRRAGLEPLVRERTGLTIDAYFSGTKIRFILDRIADGQRRAEAGELLFGTVDTWLLWRLSGGAVHATDATNASRTMLFDIRNGRWDDDLPRALTIPLAMLPEVRPSSGSFAVAAGEHFGAPIPIAGIAGDQHAALFGQACTRAGEAKNTYGTGCFLLANTGAELRRADGLLSTIAIELGGSRSYALEGSAFVTGAAVQWLRDGLGLIADAAETDALAASLSGNDGVYLVPAFVGLGAPHWDMYARGLLIGISRGTTRAHLARATLESIAYQTRDLVEAMRAAGQPLTTLRVDGGGTANRFLMQFQADVLGVPVEVAAMREMTALGAAYLAGLAVGVWRDAEALRARRRVAERFEPRMSREGRDTLYAEWLRAVERGKGWAEPSGSEPGPAS
ncbi:MAG: glycerol kinase [Chloroflexi bacterium 13_1_40CM_4_68_4]|nr:MAG: glycerol kinase [Chloroflexi bacterium 13_1_40CM_4_68_4]